MLEQTVVQSLNQSISQAMNLMCTVSAHPCVTMCFHALEFTSVRFNARPFVFHYKRLHLKKQWE